MGYAWTLAFGTSKHGMSIKSLYRAMQGQDTPVLMVIKDSDGQVSVPSLPSGGEKGINSVWSLGQRQHRTSQG